MLALMIQIQEVLVFTSVAQRRLYPFACRVSVYSILPVPLTAKIYALITLLLVVV